MDGRQKTAFCFQSWKVFNHETGITNLYICDRPNEHDGPCSDDGKERDPYTELKEDDGAFPYGKKKGDIVL